MNVMDDISERLNETERRASDIVSRLERLNSVRGSLSDAAEGLDKANENVVKVAAAIKDAVDALTETVVALREAVNVIQRSHPAAVEESLARTEAEIGRMSTKLAAVDELRAELKVMRETIPERVDNSEKETRRLIESAVERLAKQTVTDRQTITESVANRRRRPAS